jgi:pyruvate dehydrogenase E1 component alpha subunit/2-oxoisovalerate dehydrogenase E1 component alpha subunit
LPLILVVANNQYAYSTPTELQFACRSLVERAAGYGVAGVEVDGTDLGACLDVLGGAVARARAGGGPQLIVANLLRLCGHGEHDDASYIDPKLKQAAVGRDCLKLAEERLVREGWATPVVIEQWRQEKIQKVEDAVARVQREAGPDPFKEDWYALSSKHLNEGHGDV